MKKLKRILIVGLLSTLLFNCSGDDDSPAHNSVGTAYVKFSINGSEVFNRTTDAPIPSEDRVIAIWTTEAMVMNESTIPANSVLIYSMDTLSDSSPFGKSIMAIFPNVTGTGSYSVASLGGKFVYMDTTNPSSSYICYVDEPYETDATLTITEVGNIAQGVNGKYVKGTLVGQGMSGLVSNPDTVVSINLQFNGGMP